MSSEEKMYNIPNYNYERLELKDLEVKGYFSVDSNGEYQKGSSQLKYIYPSYLKDQQLNPHFDLNKDYDKIKPKGNRDARGRFKRFANWLKENSGKVNGADIVCFRGLLTSTILSMPTEFEIDWKIGAYKINNIIYLYAFDTEKKIQKEMKMLSNESIQQSVNWGFKFEHFMLTDDPSIKPTGDGELNLSEEFCTIFRSKLGSLNLMYSAEMDGIISPTKIDPDTDLKESEFVELKTGLCHGFKLLKWWAQSYFVGIRKIIRGNKDGHNITYLENVGIKHLEKIYPKYLTNRYEKPNSYACCHYLLNILKFIRETALSEPPKFWIFDWDPLHRNEIRASITDLPEYKFLDDDFISFMKENTIVSESSETMKEENEERKQIKRPRVDDVNNGEVYKRHRYERSQYRHSQRHHNQYKHSNNNRYDNNRRHFHYDDNKRNTTQEIHNRDYDQEDYSSPEYFIDY